MNYLLGVPSVSPEMVRAMNQEEQSGKRVKSDMLRSAGRVIARAAKLIRARRAAAERTTGMKIIPEPPSIPLG